MLPDDVRWMQRAIAISKRGLPAPNPHVGCVIVRDGVVLGEGFHDLAGGPHAEVAAIRNAKVDLNGATAYVTLEPCNHTGRTGPCTQALLAAGVARVAVAVADPNPRAAGGAETLRESGVEVVVGLLAEEAAAANEQFLFAHRHRRSMITAKAAISLDGRIALPNGQSQWITGEAARRDGHRLRAECGAVLVGRGTVLADDPRLTVRLNRRVNQPVRIVLDPSHKLTGTEQVFNGEAETIHVTGEIDLPKLATTWFQRGLTGVLVEGGATTVRHFLAEDLVDRLVLYMAPKILGSGKGWVEDLIRTDLGETTGWRFEGMKRLGEDLRLRYRRER
jgi:diaminohydroxyphosphoribosylaminopyrimidine deaminase/5-amino-6-(5-phosphoribosylamino)uracil reductase